MKRILIFAKDPGEVNVLFPLIEPLQDLNFLVDIFAVDRALKKFADYGFVAKDLKFYAQEDFDSLFGFLKNDAPDFLLTGSGGGFWERFLWVSARKLSIPSVAIIDNWINLGIRFSRYSLEEKELFDKNPSFDFFPDKICVVDDFAKKRIVKEGVPSNMVFVSQNPYFDFLENFANGFKNSSSVKKRILFASEPLTENYGKKNSLNLFGHTELSVLNALVDVLDNFKDEDFELIIRPHPNENDEKFNSILQKNDLELKVDKKTPSLELISSSDLVCGMSSMFLIEALSMQIPVMSILLNLSGKSIFILEELGIFHSIRDEKNLYNSFVKFFNSEFDSIKINGFFKKGGIDNIINLVRSML